MLHSLTANKASFKPIPFQEGLNIVVAKKAEKSEDNKTRNSLGKRYSNTRPETMRLAARLMETGIDFAAINRQLFDKITPEEAGIESRYIADYVSVLERHGMTTHSLLMRRVIGMRTIGLTIAQNIVT